MGIINLKPTSLEDLIEEIRIDANAKYNFAPYMQHMEGCSIPSRGSDFCQCGMAVVRANVEDLIDMCRFASGWSYDHEKREWISPEK